MVRHTNVVEQTVQLADDGGDLLRQVASVHGHARQQDGNVSCNTAGRYSEASRVDGQAVPSGGFRNDREVCALGRCGLLSELR